MDKKEIMKHSFEKHLYSGETEEEMKKDIIRQAVEYILKFESLSSELCLQGTRQKLIQSRTQAIEIKTGDFLEEYFNIILEKSGYKLLSKKIDGKRCDIYCCHEKQKRIILVEMKIRDGHDSTKKDGQATNFDTKIQSIIDKDMPKYSGFRRRRC